MAEVLAAVPLPMILVGRDTRLAQANGLATALIGDQSLGRHLALAIRQPALVEAVEAALQRRVAGQARFVQSAPTHEVAWKVTVTPVTQGALCVFQDISEQEQIGQLRRDFVANVSHELRTPLTALLGFIETLQGPARDDPAARDRFLAIMAREAGRMNRLVRDLLSLSRVEAQERQRPADTVDVASLLATSVTTMRAMAEDAGVELVLTADPGPQTARADADQLTQVFTNLIENAVKYGRPGKRVTITLTRLAEAPGFSGPALRISVADEGEGIDELHLPRLTERFYRVDSHRSRAQGGTGLGLAIVKHIVNRHRGRLKIASTRGAGSTFTVLLPLA